MIAARYNVGPHTFKENMKLSEIKLLTEAYREKISGDTAVDLLRKHCRDALKSFDTPIVRGMNPDGRWQLITGEDGGRGSANTTNHYTVIMDEVLPPEFPRRSKSIICASYANRIYAADFGTRYAIFPFDGVKIGVAPEYDLWDTKITLGREEFKIVKWNRIFQEAGLPSDSYKSFLTQLEELRANPRPAGSAPQLQYYLPDMEDDLDKMFRREYTRHFKVTTTADPIYNPGSHEVWISGKCVAIEFEYFLEMKDELKAEIFDEAE